MTTYKFIVALFVATFVAFVGLLLTTTPVQGGWFSAETPGDRFREGMKKRERFCATHKRLPNDISCEILELKPPDPYATPEGAFAHSLKLPGPPPKQVYKRGMSSEEYFKALCAAEAGEFIFRTVEVEGIFLMRPRQKATDAMFKHLYAMEDPYGYTDAEATEPEFMFVSPARYRFLEMPLRDLQISRIRAKHYRNSSYLSVPTAGARVQSYENYDRKSLSSMVLTYKETRVARYGYTWRGIHRPNDRELGIAGGELIVVDLSNNEVLGVRRGFTKSSNVRNHITSIGWEFAAACPSYAGEMNKHHDFAYWFVSKVLVPPSGPKDHGYQLPLRKN